MKRLHHLYLYGYRFIGFIFLLGLVTSILWYGFSLLFFIIDSNWSVPFIISPNQENVLIHQERLLNMEDDLLKNTIDLKSAKNELKNKLLILADAQNLYARMQRSLQQQSSDYNENSRAISGLSKEKAKSIQQLKRLLADIKEREQLIENELSSGLITRQEALTERIGIQNARSSLVDAKARVQEFNQRSREFNTAADTLNGAADNLTSMQNLVKKFDLSRQISQLKTDIFSLQITVKNLEKKFLSKKNVLTMIKKSPYILATKKPTHVAFVPYSNLNHVKVGGPVYSCYLDILFCYKSGHVTRIYAAEEYGKHPILKSDIKGQFIGIAFNDEQDAQKKLLFFNSKPLLI